MTAMCRLVQSRLPSRDGEEFGGAVGRHIESCLRCQAEQARYLSMRRKLHMLEGLTYVAPPDLAAAVIADLDREGAESAESAGADVRRKAVAAAAGAAVVAAGAVVVLGMRRGRAA